MPKHTLQRVHKFHGFTIIEVMIVLAVASLIMVVVALGASQAAKTNRDNHRKAYARQVFEALQEYNKNNGKFPGCDTRMGCPATTMQNFMNKYMPDGRDPSTGNAYRSTPFSASGDTAYGGSATVKSANSASVYVDNGVWHYLKPNVGQIVIATAHWCYVTTGKDPGASGADHGPPLAGAKQDPVTGQWDQDFSKFAILIYQERGEYYCLDNYARSGDPLEE
jgi:prepilin-type N-terminal cleavage/methylation domain-containing protein